MTQKVTGSLEFSDLLMTPNVTAIKKKFKKKIEKIFKNNFLKKWKKNEKNRKN